MPDCVLVSFPGYSYSRLGYLGRRYGAGIRTNLHRNLRTGWRKSKYTKCSVSIAVYEYYLIFLDFILKGYSPLFLKFFNINLILCLSVRCVRWWFKKLYGALLRKLKIKQGALLKKSQIKPQLFCVKPAQKSAWKLAECRYDLEFFLISCLWHAHFDKLFLRDGHCTTCQETFSATIVRNMQGRKWRIKIFVFNFQA
jgi:hypothetical protein